MSAWTRYAVGFRAGAPAQASEDEGDPTGPLGSGGGRGAPLDNRRDALAAQLGLV